MRNVRLVLVVGVLLVLVSMVSLFPADAYSFGFVSSTPTANLTDWNTPTPDVEGTTVAVELTQEAEPTSTPDVEGTTVAVELTQQAEPTPTSCSPSR